MTEEQFNALIVLIDAMIDYKLTGNDIDWQRAVLLEKDAKELIVNAARKALEKGDE